MVDVAHHGDDRRPHAQRLLVFLLVVVEQREQLELLLLTGVDEQDIGTDLGCEELDHVVGQRHRGGDHLALLQQEAHDVGRRAVQLGAEVLGGGPALDDDLALGDGASERV